MDRFFKFFDPVVQGLKTVCCTMAILNPELKSAFFPIAQLVGPMSSPKRMQVKDFVPDFRENLLVRVLRPIQEVAPHNGHGRSVWSLVIV
jgi:hypothetical protein